MRHDLATTLLGAVLLGAPLAGQGFTEGRPGHLEVVPSLTVAGRGEARVAPDEATVRLGVLAQQASAGAAQQSVNRVVTAVLDALSAPAGAGGGTGRDLAVGGHVAAVLRRGRVG